MKNKAAQSLDRNNVKLKYAAQIWDLLLKEQIDAVGATQLKAWGVFDLIQTEKVSDYLEIDDAQHQRIRNATDRKFEELKLLITQQQETLRKKQREVEAILTKNLDADQKEKLGRLLNLEDKLYFSKSDLQHLLRVTTPDDIKLETETRKD